MSHQTDIRRITPEQRAILRRRMDIDPWYFSVYVCKRDQRAMRHHRPMLYLFARRAALLAACLDDPEYDGPITRQIKADFEKLSNPIDWKNPEHLPRIQRRLRKINFRGPRSGGKSVFADDADLWEASSDPDITISVGSKSDPAVWKRIEAIGDFVRSDEYKFWYPERVPLDPRTQITRDAIWLNGRSRIVPEATIEGRGIASQWFGSHYRKNRRDDITGVEAGEASLGDAIRHLANMNPLHDETGWVGDLVVGTVTGSNDDHSMLKADTGYLTIALSIEEHPGGTTLENVYSDGILTMPEWFDRERVNEIKEDSRKNPLGPIWLLQNYYMVANESGTTLFTQRLVNRAKFYWYFDHKLKRDIILRPKKGRENTFRPPMNEQGYMMEDPRFVQQDWLVLDTHKLPISAFGWAADQSVSPTGDEWSFAYGCMDWDGVILVLDSVAGNGYDTMLDETIPFDKKCHKPKFGIDVNATQGMTLEWMKRTPEFRSLARRAKPIRSTGESKDANIRRWLLARMEAGDLYVNPRLIHFIDECLKYQPRKPDGMLKRNPVDNRLDAGWMMCTLLTRPVSPEQMDEDALDELVAQEQYRRTSDPMTGINTDNWMSSMWKTRAA